MRLVRIIFGCLLVLTVRQLAADGVVRDGLEDFTVSILQLPASTSTKAAVASAGASTGALPPELGLAKGTPPPRMSLTLAPSSLGSELGLGGRGSYPTAAPDRDRRLERLRADWAAVDARRLERSRREDGTWNRAVEAVFPAEPAVWRVGHTELGGGLINALKRRNPFCLLNPVFFHLSF